jgi:hypothetical protein
MGCVAPGEREFEKIRRVFKKVPTNCALNIVCRSKITKCFVGVNLEYYDR